MARVAFAATRVAAPERFVDGLAGDFLATVRAAGRVERFAVAFFPEDDSPPVLREAPALLFFALLRRTVPFAAARFGGAPALPAVFVDERLATDFVARSFAVDFFGVARLVVRAAGFAAGFFAPVDFDDAFFADVLLDEPPLRAKLFDEPPEPLFFAVLRNSSRSAGGRAVAMTFLHLLLSLPGSGAHRLPPGKWLVVSR